MVLRIKEIGGKQIRKYFYIILYKYSNPNKTKISKEAPEWFDIVPEWKAKLFDKSLIKKEDTIMVFSRYQNWITVTPKGKDRKKALEKIKTLKKEQTSKVMPKWMEIENKTKKPEEIFKIVEYNNPVRQKTKGLMAFVDKIINPKRLKPIAFNPSRSIFNIDDFRHNVRTDKDRKIFDSTVSQLPRKFFDWDDGKKFNPKTKKDV